MSIKLMPYNPHVQMLRSTYEPERICAQAAMATQQCAIESMPQIPGTISLIQNIAEMGHTSVFEHASVTFLLENVSRGCMDQITRHRIGSFTCSSTHYEAHEDSIYLVPAHLLQNRAVYESCLQTHYLYIAARNKDEIGAEARQLLPLAISCRLMWTVNARSLLNFLRLRLCRRNMQEIIMVAEQVLTLSRNWFPELFDSKAPLPECMRTKCDQGHMTCGK